MMVLVCLYKNEHGYGFLRILAGNGVHMYDVPIMPTAYEKLRSEGVPESK